MILISTRDSYPIEIQMWNFPTIPRSLLLEFPYRRQFTQLIIYPNNYPNAPCMEYLPTSTLKIIQMQVIIPYMEYMGYNILQYIPTLQNIPIYDPIYYSISQLCTIYYNISQSFDQVPLLPFSSLQLDSLLLCAEAHLRRVKRREAGQRTVVLTRKMTLEHLNYIVIAIQILFG